MKQNKKLLYFLLFLFSFFAIKEYLRKDSRQQGQRYILPKKDTIGFDTIKIISKDFWTGKTYFLTQDSTIITL